MAQSNINFPSTTIAHCYINIPTGRIGIHTENCGVYINHVTVTENGLWSEGAQLSIVRDMAHGLAKKTGFVVDTDICRRCR